ncbi:hypothetical protein MYCTH_2295596 [Thermothelomyces thermophilus ATCC 42464]|uniref:Zn(2)-C6 fungal-type domain-containing protein n=1 Tax=Thermothelomyces thermophilus (strain ATCC 42464 / BCRC 31852 / DSM 1799) TaxID=573729 RepID=G2Q5G1_THET4|nr:uncharacterized protein MYCTH_2295596 [Thermothelomyces thermophilus ATCC 42464]AEO53792.1 hypothetical protein MYCTH_2295596 [Thermothelomyces thermophilus ATCC 42464]
MLRRSHKKSRAGCLECKRRHVKCDEQRPKCIICTLSDRECSYPPLATDSSGPSTRPAATTAAAAAPAAAATREASASSAFLAAAINTSNASDASPVAGVPLPDIASRGRTSPDNAGNNTYPEVNLGHMELLIRFNFEEHAPELNVEMHDFASKLLFKCALEAPYLMHQILAISARRLAALQPERSKHLLETAIHLQTRAVSIYNETAARSQIDQSNCSTLLLFCSLLGRHLLADLLARRDADFGDFLARFLEFLSISRGLMAMSVAAWDLLLQSDIKHLVLWALEISQSTPQGHHCDELQRLVLESTELDESSKEACVAAIAYLQVGFDSLLGGDTRNQRYLMVFMW